MRLLLSVLLPEVKKQTGRDMVLFSYNRKLKVALKI